MAELILSNVGEAVGSTLLPEGLSVLGQEISGEAIGRFVGSMAGAAIDSYLFAPQLEGPRLQELHVTQSREGAHIPIVYGRMRLGGNVIWASRFKEHANERSAGKGGPSITEYAYSISFAVGVCEGEISRLVRVWANGAPLDLSQFNWRMYKGKDDQAPDALIEAIEGAAPAYRGLAYIVFEDMPLDQFGNRLPQLSFEIERQVRSSNDWPSMEEVVTGINLIPGAGEFVYSDKVVSRKVGPGQETPENRHNDFGVSDFEASLDELLDAFPNLAHVNLIVGWFGDDLRCGCCQIRPGVETRDKETRPISWRVAGQDRHSAYLITSEDGRPNYGGTPDDASVIAAIKMLKTRGLKVTLYPFLFMDVPAGNGLPDPWGGSEQPAFPWRGRVTCHPALGQFGSPDGTGAIEAEITSFFGSAVSADFSVSGKTVAFSGAVDWGYHRFILHYAALAKAAGGVDAFLIGSEMVSMTRLRNASGFPAVDQLKQLAGEVRTLLGPAVKLSYAADWTEYGGYVPGDAPDDLHFPLDALWADQTIDFVGLDWYPPLSDWRETDSHADRLDGWARDDDHAYLTSRIESGEGFDWYYASDADRSLQNRTPIADGAHQEPWVYRQKDIRSWWSNTHYNRLEGVRSTTSTDWIPSSKPVRFVEFGCPAVDKGANQPNVFYDPKSSENALPHYSTGLRNDVIQRRAIEAFCTHWAGDPMLDEGGVSIWAWDMRPFPAWPIRKDVWSDGGNWRLGHWLNGRTGLAMLADVVFDIAQRTGLSIDTSAVTGVVTGYALNTVMTVRGALEPLFHSSGLACVEDEMRLVFRSEGDISSVIDEADFVATDSSILAQFETLDLEREDIQVRLQYLDRENEYQIAVATTALEAERRVADVSIPVVMDRSAAQDAARKLEAAANTRSAAQVGLPLLWSNLEPGDVVPVKGRDWRIDRIDMKDTVSLNLRPSTPKTPMLHLADAGRQSVDQHVSKPEVWIADLPPLPGEEDDARPCVFAFAAPWRGYLDVMAGADASALTRRCRIEKPSVTGELLTDLPAGAPWRWRNQTMEVKLYSGELSAQSELAVLNGANAFLVETENGWELMQFQSAELVSDGCYRLSKLLRGQQGTEHLALLGALKGARIVVLNGAPDRLDLKSHEYHLPMMWQARFFSDHSAVSDGVFTAQQSAQLPFSPAHLKAHSTADDLHISWIRRGRIGGDAWSSAEPLLEGVERYRVTVHAEDTLIRSWETGANSLLYSAMDMASDFPSGGLAKVAVSQLGPDRRPGPDTHLTAAI